MDARILIFLAGLTFQGGPIGADDRPVPPRETSWQVGDFDGVLFTGLEGYRDFDNGGNVFTRAGCVRCHRFDGKGPDLEVVPDLEKVAVKLPPRDLLEEILEPSKKIVPAHAVLKVTLDDGRSLKGLVREESNAGLHLVPDASEPGKSVFLRRDRIRKSVLSETSAMPTGLLDRFREEDVLDLLAYLLSGGNPNDAMFRK